jgi:hypothetical protein
VLARIIEPVSKLDSLRVLDEAGVPPASYRTVKRRLPAYAEEQWTSRDSRFGDRCRQLFIGAGFSSTRDEIVAIAAYASSRTRALAG